MKTSANKTGNYTAGWLEQMSVSFISIIRCSIRLSNYEGLPLLPQLTLGVMLSAINSRGSAVILSISIRLSEIAPFSLLATA